MVRLKLEQFPKVIEFSGVVTLPVFVAKSAISCMEYIKDSHVVDEDPVFAKKVNRDPLRCFYSRKNCIFSNMMAESESGF